MRNFLWIGVGLSLLSLFAFPTTWVVLVSIFAAVACLAVQLRRGWRFIAPERTKLARGILLSVEHGPVASGLAPFLASGALCLLIFAAAMGMRL